jgi:hypothetical protein
MLYYINLIGESHRVLKKAAAMYLKYNIIPESFLLPPCYNLFENDYYFFSFNYPRAC